MGKAERKAKLVLTDPLHFDADPDPTFHSDADPCSRNLARKEDIYVG